MNTLNVLKKMLNTLNVNIKYSKNNKFTCI